MGREYFGSISGKFGFGLQSSCDIESLINITYKEEYEYYGCRCQVEEEFNKEKYCNNCFDSYEEHYESLEDEIDENDKIDDCLYYQTQFILYDINYDNHYFQLLESLNNLKEKLPKDIIEEFEKIKENEEIIDGYSNIFQDVYKVYDNYINNYINNNSKLFSFPLSSINNEDNRVLNIEKNDNDFILSFLRYKLGMQVKYVLEKEGNCYMQCET